MEFTHKPVLLAECIEALHIRPEGIYVDGTLGRAGTQERSPKGSPPAGWCALTGTRPLSMRPRSGWPPGWTG